MNEQKDLEALTKVDLAGNLNKSIMLTAFFFTAAIVTLFYVVF